jgi:hypothetical protein
LLLGRHGAVTAPFYPSVAATARQEETKHET